MIRNLVMLATGIGAGAIFTSIGMAAKQARDTDAFLQTLDAVCAKGCGTAITSAHLATAIADGLWRRTPDAYTFEHVTCPPPLAAVPEPLESRPLPVDGDYVIVHTDAKGEWRWTMRAANHEIIAGSGEGYRDQAHASSMALRVTGIIPDVRP